MDWMPLGSTTDRVLSLAWDVPSVVTCPTFVGNETFSPSARAVAEGDGVAPDPEDPAMLEAEETLGTLGPHAELHRRVLQLAVLRHAAAFLSHAGMNSTMEALAAGVPLVDVPQTGEQRMVAGQVAARRCGLALEPEASVERMTAASEEVLSSAPVAADVSAMRQAIASTGGAVAAADAVEAAALRGRTRLSRDAGRG